MRVHRLYLSSMQRITVGVLRGGPSREYEASLQSGATVLAELDRTKYEPRDIFVSRAGEWHVNGVPMMPERALRSVDSVFNVIHGEYGEDGRAQRILEAAGVPYTGPDALVSALAFNKKKTKDIVSGLGIKTPYGLVLDSADVNERSVLDLFRSFPMPAMVKPLTGGSSVGTTLAMDYRTLAQGIETAMKITPRMLIEEYIRGKEATVGVVDAFRGQDHYSLLPVEIIPPAACPFFDYEAKYSGKSQEVCPGNFTEREKGELADMAREVHRALRLRDYSRSDFIVSRRGIYFLEANSAPAIGLFKESLFPKAIHAIGSKLSDFFDHVIERTRSR